jgi:hypothetical protein
MIKKFYTVLTKNGHYYLEIFKVTMRKAGQLNECEILSSALDSKEDIEARKFRFKSFLDLRHNNPTNIRLREEFGEDRIFFNSKLEAINQLKFLYNLSLIHI